MYPDIEYVLRKRYLLTIVYRLGVMLLLVLGLLPLARIFIEGVVILPIYMQRLVVIANAAAWKDLMMTYLPTSGEYLLTALFLAILQRRLVCWITPLPKPQCPQCGYDIKKLSGTRCPECGQELPIGLVKLPD